MAETVLFLLVVLMPTSWAAAGYLILLPAGLDRNKGSKELNVAIYMVAGLAANFAVFHLFRNIISPLIFLGLALLSGLTVLIVKVTRKEIELKPRFSFSLVILLLLFVLVSLATIHKPIFAWDARSIWFFQAKQLHFTQNLDAINWKYFGFWHADYPKLTALLGSQITTLIGYWNEFVPKLLIPMLTLPFFFYFRASVFGGFYFLVISILFMIVNGNLGWEGYNDTFLAIYAATAVHAISKYFDNKRISYFYYALFASGIILGLKNEGLLILISIALAALIWSVFNWSSSKVVGQKLINIKVLLYGIVASAGWLLWTVYKWQHKIGNDLKIGNGSWDRIVERISNGEAVKILQNLLITNGFLWLIFFGCGLSAFFIFVKKLRLAEIAIPQLAAIIYAFGIFLIYLQTPQNLQWHLDVSASRTISSAVLMSMAGFLYFFRRPATNEPPAKLSDN